MAVIVINEQLCLVTVKNLGIPVSDSFAQALRNSEKSGVSKSSSIASSLRTRKSKRTRKSAALRPDVPQRKSKPKRPGSAHEKALVCLL